MTFLISFLLLFLISKKSLTSFVKFNYQHQFNIHKKRKKTTTKTKRNKTGINHYKISNTTYMESLSRIKCKHNDIKCASEFIWFDIITNRVLCCWNEKQLCTAFNKYHVKKHIIQCVTSICLVYRYHIHTDRKNIVSTRYGSNFTAKPMYRT